VSVIAPGTPAPQFSLGRRDGSRFQTQDLIGVGEGTILVFYPFAFSPVCTEQLVLYEDLLEELRGRSLRLFGVSCDSTWAQAAFAKELGVSSEQLSDFEPKGATARAFGVLHDGGFCERALVMLDAEGVVRWSYMAPTPGDLPGVDVLREGISAAFGAP
jgi:peroxiredoxin